MYPNYGDWILKVGRRFGFKPRIVKEADVALSALAFVAAGYGLAMGSEPLQKIPAKDVILPNLPPEDRAWMPDRSAASKFIDALAHQVCGDGSGE